MTGAATTDASELPSPAQPTPKHRSDLALSVLDAEAIVYDSRSGAVHCFNPTTLHVWQSCDGRRTVSRVATDLAERFDLDSAEARHLVLQAIEELNRRRLFEEDDPAAIAVSDSGVSELETEFAPLTPRGPKPAAQGPASVSQRSISRRELLAGGATKLALAAPVISTFFATGAYASGLSLSGSYGTDGGGACKTVGYSCTVNGDCCDGPIDTLCQPRGAPTDTCCLKDGRGPCTDNTDCCDALTCSIGVCG